MDTALDPRRTALLVIDMQRNAFESDDPRARLVRESGIAERLAELLPKARAAGVLIVYVYATSGAEGRRQGGAPNQGGVAGPGRAGGGGRRREGNHQVAAEPSDYRVIKRRRNAFLGTDLDL